MRILYITPAALEPPTAGGRQRSNLVYRALAEVGDVDTFWIERETFDTPEPARIMREKYHTLGASRPQGPSELGLWKYLRPIAPAMVNRIANFADPAALYSAPQPRMMADLRRAVDPAKYDWVVARHIYCLLWTDLVGKYPNTIADADDFESIVLETRIASGAEKGLRSNMARRAARVLKKRESQALAKCRHVFLCKPADISRVGHDRYSILPNIPFVPPGGVEPVDVPMPFDPASRICLTIGSLSNGPMIHGIDAFLTNVWPRVLQRVPEAEYHIAGAHLGDTERSRWQKVAGVRIIGFVENVADVYRKAAITICPVTYGGGTNIKVVESMTYARAAVISQSALRGWDGIFDHGKTLYVAADADSFVEHCVDLLNDPAKRRMFGEAGRAIARDRFSFAKFKSVVRDALTKPPIAG